MNAKQKKNISKFISLILRHNPGVIGIKLDSHGWADVNDLIVGINVHMNIPDKDFFGPNELIEIVETDEKQRYSFNDDMTKIRANQGHSIKVDVELDEAEPPEYLYHGTANNEKYLGAIRKSGKGLLPMSRNHVHLSKDVKTAIEVGKRHGTPHVFKVHSGKMHVDGYKFYLSKNGVWLTDRVPAEYLEDMT
jgi:putative RNA 2'-phosphotransferase